MGRINHKPLFQFFFYFLIFTTSAFCFDHNIFCPHVDNWKNGVSQELRSLFFLNTTDTHTQIQHNKDRERERERERQKKTKKASHKNKQIQKQTRPTLVPPLHTTTTTNKQQNNLGGCFNPERILRIRCGSNLVFHVKMILLSLNTFSLKKYKELYTRMERRIPQKS